MKQKIILDRDVLFKDGKEIKLSYTQQRILHTLKDNLLHSHIELIKNANITRGLKEKETLRIHILRINTLTRLKIRPLKGAGYHLLDKIYVND